MKTVGGVSHFGGERREPLRHPVVLLHPRQRFAAHEVLRHLPEAARAEGAAFRPLRGFGLEQLAHDVLHLTSTEEPTAVTGKSPPARQTALRDTK